MAHGSSAPSESVWDDAGSMLSCQSGWFNPNCQLVTVPDYWKIGDRRVLHLTLLRASFSSVVSSASDHAPLCGMQKHLSAEVLLIRENRREHIR